jgi:hypothetical protein
MGVQILVYISIILHRNKSYISDIKEFQLILAIIIFLIANLSGLLIIDGCIVHEKSKEKLCQIHDSR